MSLSINHHMEDFSELEVVSKWDDEREGGGGAAGHAGVSHSLY